MNPTRRAEFGLAVQPMVHVEDLPANVRLYEELGAEIVFGSRDGDWVLLKFGDTLLGLLAHPPSAENPEAVELHFTSKVPLEVIAEHMGSIMPNAVHRGVGDEAFGRMLQLATPDGLIVKVLELERDLIE